MSGYCQYCGETAGHLPGCEMNGGYGVRLPDEKDLRIAQLEAELRQREWQPIETAPKDGTMVIFLSNTYGEFIGRIPENMAHYKRTEAIPKLSNKCIVVHKWMPLPASPAGGEDTK